MKRLPKVTGVLIVAIGTLALVAVKLNNLGLASYYKNNNSYLDDATTSIAKSNNKQAESVVEGGGREARENDAFTILEGSKTASQAYQALMRRAEGDDIAALMAIQRLVGYCYFLFADPKHGPINNSQPGSNAFKLRQAALARRKTFCDDLNGHNVAVERLLTGYQEKLDEAASNGDELAMASRLYLSRKDMDAVGIATAVEIGRTTKSPETLEMVVQALSESDDPRIAALKKQIFTGLDVQQQLDWDVVSLAAAEWLACANGKIGCGPYNYESDADCLYFGECYSHLSRMDYLRTRLLNGRQFEQMQRYLQLLNEEVLHRQ